MLNMINNVYVVMKYKMIIYNRLVYFNGNEPPSVRKTVTQRVT